MPQGGVSSSWSAGSRVAGRAGPCSVIIAGHLETYCALCVHVGLPCTTASPITQSACACLRMKLWMVPSIACMRACAWHMCTCECLHGAMCTVRTAAQTHVCVCDCMCAIVCLKVFELCCICRRGLTRMSYTCDVRVCPCVHGYTCVCLRACVCMAFSMACACNTTCGACACAHGCMHACLYLSCAHMN